MRLRNRPEHDIQSTFFDLVRLRRKKDPRWNLIFAIPVGDVRHWVVAKRLKREGVEPGIPDVLCAIPSGGYAGLWLEFKTPRGSLSRDQREKITMLREVGYRVEIVRDPQVAEQIVEEYLNGSNATLRDSSQK